MSGSSRITNRHLERSAAVYVRQSTQNQVLKNRESRQRQYGLADRARELGWPDERILIIDSDLGQSATSQGTRSGFGQLCEQVSQGRVGKRSIRHRSQPLGPQYRRVVPVAGPVPAQRHRCWSRTAKSMRGPRRRRPDTGHQGHILRRRAVGSSRPHGGWAAEQGPARRALFEPSGRLRPRGRTAAEGSPTCGSRRRSRRSSVRFREGGSGLQATHLCGRRACSSPSRPHGAGRIDAGGKRPIPG